MLGQKGRGRLLVVEGRIGSLQAHRGWERRRAERMTEAASVVLHQVLVGGKRPGPCTRLSGDLPLGDGVPHGAPHHGGGLLHGDQRAVALGVGEVPGGLADGTDEAAEDRTGDQAAGSPQSVGSALLLRQAVLQAELTAVSTRHLGA